MLVAVFVGGTVYVTRRAIAREVLIGWLDARGVPADVEFREFEFGGFTARVRAGPQNDPDVSVERVEVHYGFTGFWTGEPLGVRVASVKLYRPVARGSYKAGKLSFGSLDPLIEEFTKRPPQPEGPQPAVEIHRGVVRIDTDYGLLKATADGRMQNGKLMALDARLDPVALRGPGLEADLREASLKLATTRDRVDLVLIAPAASLKAGGISARDAKLNVSLQGPYPDLKKRSGDGKVVARLVLDSGSADFGADQARGVHLTARFDGASTGWIETLALQGQGDVQASLKSGKLAGVEVRAVIGQASLGDLRWTRVAGDVVSAEISSRIAAASARAGDLSLTDPRADFGGLVAFDPRRADIALRGAISSRGAWSGLGPVRAGDPAETAALKRALAGFQLNANSVAISASHEDLAISLGTPVKLRTDSGGELLVYQTGGPVFADGAGALGVAVKGGGLPEADLQVARYVLTRDGLDARLALKAKGGFAPVSGGSVDAAGDLRIAGTTTSFTASRCVSLTADHVELGDSDLERLSGEVCPSGAPLLSLNGGAWRVRGQARGLAVELPFLEARLSQASGPIDLRGAGERIDGTVTVASARLDDTAAETRFNPVRAKGQARAQDGGWVAGFDVADLAGRHLGRGDLRHRADGRGELDFDTGMLAFEDGGLQPIGLSPIAALVASPATGRARFAGQIGWAPGASTSHGTLDVERLDFVSPMGPVIGLAGHVEFDSLLPLTAAPGQSLRAEAVNTLVPLTDVELSFGLQGDALTIGGARLAVGGGSLDFEPFSVPFAPGAPWKGVVNFQGVQVKELVEASPFGDRVDLEARLSGRAPFEVTPQGVRVAGGTLRAIEPGRLSILREALVPVASSPVEATIAGATSGVQVPVTEPAAAPGEVNAFSEFAYQAMEHLSFSALDAEVNSLDNGRLGVLLHVKGEHTPPQKQEIRLTIMELIRRDFLNRTLPLPSGTKVNLTLDTSLNLDELLKDFADYQALRGSQAVQPR